MATSFVQTHLPVKITTPLSAVLIVKGFQGRERISDLFEYRLELQSEDGAIDFSQIVGKPVTLEIPLTSGATQYVNGIVSRFAQGGSDDRFTSYFADVRPWLWFLSLNAGCAIYQNQSTPDIVKAVFSRLGFTDFKDQLTGTYTPRDYCVQYRETAFAFVSRLMEEEGIFYFFEHTSGSHTLVLADDSSAWPATPGLTAARVAGQPTEWFTDDAITSCSLEQSVTVSKYTLDDFNFETPSVSMAASSGDGATPAIFDYPGLYSQQSTGETIAGKRLLAREVEGKMLTGASLCRAFHAGAKFKVSGHPVTAVNADHVVLSLVQSGSQTSYSNSFEAFPSTITFRPPQATPRPVIAGTQTAVVVGKAGEEIWTDQYGRVKVQFHWDQAGQNDENSSCWIRVAQGWAGQLWGGFFLPRIGQEVVVSFLEGNPDRPLITGCVYNAQQTVPYTLPDNQTRSTIKTNSSKGGNGFNEIRFEDLAGSEELFIQAQKDMNVKVLNDQTTTITNNRSVTIQKQNDTLTVSEGNRTFAVSKGNESYTVQGTRDITVNGKETRTNGADYITNVTGNFTLKVSGNISIEASGSVSIKSGTSFANEAGTSMTNKAGTSMSNEAQADLTNKGGASQTVDGGGMLTLKGGLVKIN